MFLFIGISLLIYHFWCTIVKLFILDSSMSNLPSNNIHIEDSAAFLTPAASNRHQVNGIRTSSRLSSFEYRNRRENRDLNGYLHVGDGSGVTNGISPPVFLDDASVSRGSLHRHHMREE